MTRATSRDPCVYDGLKQTHEVPMQNRKPAVKIVTRRPKWSAMYPPSSAPKMQPMLYVMFYQSVKSSHRVGSSDDVPVHFSYVWPCHSMR
jgi:hypothetical protein